ncbi:MAG TPA: hypothetical protein VFA10_31750 [Ktedonobacteraceae bacterium]|nr:hypothetical protein [Ktedonobacteraceae bacterium]
MKDMKQEWVDMLTNTLRAGTPLPLFLVARQSQVFWIPVDQRALGGSQDGAEIVFQQGRQLGQQHPDLYHKAFIAQIAHVKALDTGEERVLVSMMAEKDGTVNAIPYMVERDSQGTLLGLHDTGGIAEVSGIFLSAFTVGLKTARQSDEQARAALERELARMAAYLTQGAEHLQMWGHQQQDTVPVCPIMDSLLLGFDPKAAPCLRNLVTNASIQVMAVVWIDTRVFPVFRSVVEAQSTVESGDIRVTWEYLHRVPQNPADALFTLRVHLERPVTAAFAIPVPMIEWGKLIEGILASGMLTLFQGPPPGAWRKQAQNRLVDFITQSGPDITLHMDPATIAELRREYTQWKARASRK